MCFFKKGYNKNAIDLKYNYIIIYKIYCDKEAAKETLPESKHITFLHASMPLDTRLAGSYLHALCMLHACPIFINFIT